MPKRTPAEDRRSRPTESAIPDETIRSTGLSAASVLAAHLRAEQRSEAYLAEAQRLSHTGSFVGVTRSTKAKTASSAATTSIQVYGTPSDAVLEMLRRQAGAGVSLTVRPHRLGGFMRLRTS